MNREPDILYTFIVPICNIDTSIYPPAPEESRVKVESYTYVRTPPGPEERTWGSRPAHPLHEEEKVHQVELSMYTYIRLVLFLDVQKQTNPPFLQIPVNSIAMKE